MVAGEDEQKGEGKGFAGLAALVSDVDTTLLAPAKQGAAGSGSSSGAERPNASQNAQIEPQPTQQQPYQAPSRPSAGSSTGKWVLGVAAVFWVFWLIGEGNKQSSSPAPAYSPPAQNAAPSYSVAPAQPQAPSRPEETKPPVGQDLVFSTEQIRYCLAEEIRTEGARSVLNSYSDSDVDRFNVLVADYNSRCGSFRYRSGALESAQQDVKPYRSQLQAEGRSRFARSPSTGTLSAPAPSRPVPDATVQAIQRKLNELGYNVGPADGLMGRSTRSAIIAYQSDMGIAGTGVPDRNLLLHLQRTVPIANTGSDPAGSLTAASPDVENAPVAPSLGTERPSVPANAWVSGSNWYCNDGYLKVGDKCIAAFERPSQ